MRLKSTLALLALLLTNAPTPVRADYAAGLQAYDSGDYTTAYMEWLPLAKQGDAKAQHGLALLYETGHGVPNKDDGEAAKWYAAAALQGIAESQANLALMFAEGRGVKQDYKRAAGLWEQAAEKGVAVAGYDLGLLYLNGSGVDKDPAKAAAWFEKAATLKVVDAQYAIARLYRFGTGVPQDLAKARSWYEQAAAAGNTLAAKELAAMEAEQPATGAAPAELPPSQTAAAPQPETPAAPAESTTPAPATDDANSLPMIVTQPEPPPASAPAQPAASESPPAATTAEAAPPTPPEQPAPGTGTAETAPATPPEQPPATDAPAAGEAPAAPASTETQVATAPAIHIWLSSQKSREQAERGWGELKTAYPDLLGKLELTVREIDLGAAKGGIWYRVYAGPLATKQAAKDLCAKIKAQPPNSNCLVATD